MLILQVALGVVLGGIILFNLPTILALGVWVIAGLVVLGVGALIVIFFSSVVDIKFVLSVLLVLAIAGGIFYWLSGK